MPDAQQISPEQDIKPLMDEIDRLLAEEGAGAMPPAMPAGPGMPMAEEAVMGNEVEEAPAEDLEMPIEAPAEAPAGDVSALAEMLGVDAAQAQTLYDASQQLGQLEGLSPEEVGQMMLDDFQLRMQVEKIAGGMADMAAEEIVEEPVEEVVEVTETVE